VELLAQRTNGPRYGAWTKAATSARTSATCATAILGCGRHLERAQLHHALAPVRRAPVEELVDADLRAVRVARHVHQEVPEERVGEPGR